jgi:macrolide-specific efflux system membrane fusion protein
LHVVPESSQQIPMKKKIHRHLLLLLVGMMAVILLINGRSAPTPDTGIISAVVKTGDIEETVLASGILKPVKLVAVGAQVSGRLTSLKVSLGQKVQQGDLIAEIDSLTQQNNLRTAEADVENMRAQRLEKEATLRLAETSLARRERTLAAMASSQADYEAAVSNLGTTQAQIKALDAQILAAEVGVDAARVNLGYTRIIAPINGTVLWIVTQEGQTVNATQSAPTIIILGQLDTMTVRAEISEADVVRVRPGQAVYFTILGDSERRYDAILESIEPAPESITNDKSIASSTSAGSSSASSTSSSAAIYYNGILNVPNADGRLKTYMTAEVHILLGQAKGVLTVPAAAIRKETEGRHTVQVVDDKQRISSRSVDVGLNDRINAEIRSGLKAGERVVVGQFAGDPPRSERFGPPMPIGM